ncbi:MAG: ketoacyl-ACP synthase III [Bacteroidales bacterium]|nr:ketoacyl-ACP synthase III [Bacteroidales bacterium]
MKKINAVITGIGAFIPDDVLTNEELSRMVDTSDEWIMSRVGIKERRVLKEEGKGLSYMAEKALSSLLEKTKTDPSEIEVVICSTTTPDFHFPSTASIVSERCGIRNAWAFDMEAACSGFIFALETGANMITSGKYKKVVIVAGDKMTSIVDYTDRNTCPLFGDACGAVLLEPTYEDIGVKDTFLRTLGIGEPYLRMTAGGSRYPATHDTIDKRLHYIYQEGRVVFKHAVSNMTEAALEIMERNRLSPDDVDFFIPHQANIRIIEAVGLRVGIPHEKVMVNIHKYGNTSAGTIPLCLWECEKQMKKGDKLILVSFGAGFSWGSVYLKWGYDGSQV